MLSILRQRNFALLWSAGLVSIIGDWALYTILPYYIYARTDSSLATGAMFIVQTIPRIALGSVAGVLADRTDRRRTMIIADIARMFVVLLILPAQLLGHVWLLYVIAFVISGVTQVFLPAKSALVPRIVAGDDLVAANALDTLSNNANRLVAPALGGVLLTFLGLPSVVLLDAFSFLVSAVLIAQVSIPTLHEQDNVKVTPAREGVWREWQKGLRFVCDDRVLSTIFLATGVYLLGYGIIQVLFVIYVRTILDASPLVFGSLATAQGAGGLVGAILITKLRKAMTTNRLLAPAYVASGALLLTIVAFPIVSVNISLAALYGIPIAAVVIVERTLLQRGVPDRYCGRVLGLHGAIQSLFLLVGMSTASVLGLSIGVIPLLVGAGILDVCAGLIVTIGMNEVKGGAPCD